MGEGEKIPTQTVEGRTFKATGVTAKIELTAATFEEKDGFEEFCDKMAEFCGDENNFLFSKETAEASKKAAYAKMLNIILEYRYEILDAMLNEKFEEGEGAGMERAREDPEPPFDPREDMD